ncbi:regulator, partial [Clostridium perfringens]
DVINAAITAAIAVGLVLLLGNKLKAYTILLVPAIVVIVAGTIGIVTLPYVKGITLAIGDVINKFTTLQPIVMGILISVSFAFLIVSPFSTVAVATAIALAGVGSGAANLGVVAAGFGLAIGGWKVNSFGTSIAHFLGSPKMQMANLIKKPIMMVPVLCNAAVLG